ncbi:MAG: UDP-N-acetylglucosamine 1-carboxyvinyltransferase [Symbiobacteriaceae bacterium]|nr:UDP-N-acetylglucosamine 1-carboxyvinyltransferase [Symbiobacteriaceae bacterium]
MENQEEAILIQGGKPLNGAVKINGAKNSAVALLAAAALSEGSVLLENLPNISDVDVMLGILKAIGFHVSKEGEGVYRLTAQADPLPRTPDELTRKMRASYYFMGSLLGRLGESSVALPGGCDIGERPIDQHLKGFKALGVKITEEDGGSRYHFLAPKLKGAAVFFDMITVGATINTMLAACRASGTTTLENVAREPEVIEVANFLNAMGAEVRGAGTETIRIRGVKKLGGCSYTCIPDRIEAGTYMIAAAATKGNLLLENVIPEHMEAVSAKLREAGFGVSSGLDWIRVNATGIRPQGIMVQTLPYPGFPTDLQPPMTAMLTCAEGSSRVVETIYERRFGSVDGLITMGATVRVEGQTAWVEGVEQLHGAEVTATDLRAGAALLIAGLFATGETRLLGVHHIDRGYGNMVEQLMSLGVQLKRVTL